MVIAVIVIVIFLLLVLLMLTPVRLEVNYRREQQEDRAEVIVSFWFRWLRLRRIISDLNWQGWPEGVEVGTRGQRSIQISKDRLEQLKANTDRLVDLVPDFYRQLRRFLRHVHCTRFRWQTEIGTGDAMETGVLSGLLWAIKTNLYQLLSRWIDCEAPPAFAVRPNFTQSVLLISLESIIRFRIGHAIFAIIQVFRHYWKRRKTTWQNTPFRA